MEAPDRIYMPNELLSEEWQKHIEGEDTEYIRKKALLKWANNMLSLRRDTGDDYFIPAIVVLNDLIDKLNSM